MALYVQSEFDKFYVMILGLYDYFFGNMIKLIHFIVIVQQRYYLCKVCRMIISEIL